MRGKNILPIEDFMKGIRRTNLEIEACLYFQKFPMFVRSVGLRVALGRMFYQTTLHRNHPLLVVMGCVRQILGAPQENGWWDCDWSLSDSALIASGKELVMYVNFLDAYVDIPAEQKNFSIQGGGYVRSISGKIY